MQLKNNQWRGIKANQDTYRSITRILVQNVHENECACNTGQGFCC